MQEVKPVEAIIEVFQTILEKDGHVEKYFEKAKKAFMIPLT
jgi:hypothetical protein